MKYKRYQIVIYCIILAVSVLWCSAILIAPYFANSEGFSKFISDSIYTFFSSSCHQIQSRSHILFGHKLGVCSRCTMIYFGFLAGVISYPFIRKLNNINLPSLFWLFIPLALMILDVGLDIADIHKNTFLTRDVTGFLIGLILPFFIIPGIIRVFYEYYSPPNTIIKK